MFKCGELGCINGDRLRVGENKVLLDSAVDFHVCCLCFHVWINPVLSVHFTITVSRQLLCEV